MCVCVNCEAEMKRKEIKKSSVKFVSKTRRGLRGESFQGNQQGKPQRTKKKIIYKKSGVRFYETYIPLDWTKN